MKLQLLGDYEAAYGPIAEKIINRIIECARNFDVETLYLQTKRLDGGHYWKIGWDPLEPVNYKCLDVSQYTL